MGKECFASSNSCKLFSFILTVCPCEIQAGGDTAQITDSAQIWHKCWVW